MLSIGAEPHVAGEALRIEIEAVLGALDHRYGRAHRIGAGAMSRVVYRQDDGEHAPEMAAKLFGAKLARGQRVRIESPGGGYGPPAERAHAAIQRDLRLGLVTPEAAERDYGWAGTTASSD